jgi:hypothetical protein
MPALLKLMCSIGIRSRLMPPARARSHSPSIIERTARCTATRELEQAVSIGSLGPRRLRK